MRSLRLHRDLTQEGLEHLSGVSVRHIRRMEAGAVSVGIDLYIQVSWALGVPLARLIDDSESHTGGGVHPGAGYGAEGGADGDEGLQ